MIMLPAKEHHKDLCAILQETSHILLGVGCTVYNNHTLQFSRNWVLILKIMKLASKLQVHFVNYASKLVHAKYSLPRTIKIVNTNSHKKPKPGRPS